MKASILTWKPFLLSFLQKGVGKDESSQKKTQKKMFLSKMPSPPQAKTSQTLEIQTQTISPPMPSIYP